MKVNNSTYPFKYFLPKIGQNLLDSAPKIKSLSNDIFVKSCTAPKQKLLTIKELFKLPSSEVTKDVFDRLSKDDFKKILTFPLESEATVKHVDMYSSLLKQRFDELSKGKPYKVIPIGRSLAGISEFMRFKGVDTILFPLSNLTKMQSSEIDKFVKNADGYFKYMKTKGIDFNNFSKDMNYYFVDYRASGKTLENFRKILDKCDVKGDNIHVMSTFDVFNESKIARENANFLYIFSYHFLHNQNLKSEFSPIPRLLYSQVNNFEKIINKYNANKEQQSMIVALAKLYNSMKNPSNSKIDF